MDIGPGSIPRPPTSRPRGRTDKDTGPSTRKLRVRIPPGVFRSTTHLQLINHDRGGTMSYLLQYARRPDSIGRHVPAARLDERVRLNCPGLYGDAYIRVFVEDTSQARG